MNEDRRTKKVRKAFSTFLFWVWQKRDKKRRTKDKIKLVDMKEIGEDREDSLLAIHTALPYLGLGNKEILFTISLEGVQRYYICGAHLMA